MFDVVIKRKRYMQIVRTYETEEKGWLPLQIIFHDMWN